MPVGKALFAVAVLAPTLACAPTFAWAQAQTRSDSPVIPPSAPLVSLDGSTTLGSLQVKPIPDAKGNAGPDAVSKTKLLDPPRAPPTPGAMLP